MKKKLLTARGDKYQQNPQQIVEWRNKNWWAQKILKRYKPLSAACNFEASFWVEQYCHYLFHLWMSEQEKMNLIWECIKKTEERVLNTKSWTHKQSFFNGGTKSFFQCRFVQFLGPLGLVSQKIIAYAFGGLRQWQLNNVILCCFKKGGTEHKNATFFPPFSGLCYKHMFYLPRKIYAMTSRKMPFFCFYKSLAL